MGFLNRVYDVFRSRESTEREERLYRQDIASKMLERGASAKDIEQALGINEVDDYDPVWH